MKELSNESVIHIKKGDIEYLQFRKLLEYTNEINHLYTLGTNWDFRTSNNKKYKENVNSHIKICNNLDQNYKNIVKPNQAHTDNIKIVDNKIKKDEPDFNLEQYDKTDGLITKQKNIILETTNADCILLIMYDPVKKVIANIHSGWRGTIKRISVKAIQKMIKEYNCNPKDIICCICPSIRKCHFEVEKEVKDLFESEYQDLKEYLYNIIEDKMQGNKWNIDTVLINKMILQKEGLKPENIIDSNICSVCNSDKIHSYRVEKQDYGLNAAFIEKI